MKFWNLFFSFWFFFWFFFFFFDIFVIIDSLLINVWLGPTCPPRGSEHLRQSSKSRSASASASHSASMSHTDSTSKNNSMDLSQRDAQSVISAQSDQKSRTSTEKNQAAQDGTKLKSRTSALNYKFHLFLCWCVVVLCFLYKLKQHYKRGPPLLMTSCMSNLSSRCRPHLVAPYFLTFKISI